MCVAGDRVSSTVCLPCGRRTPTLIPPSQPLCLRSGFADSSTAQRRQSSNALAMLSSLASLLPGQSHTETRASMDLASVHDVFRTLKLIDVSRQQCDTLRLAACGLAPSLTDASNTIDRKVKPLVKQKCTTP